MGKDKEPDYQCNLYRQITQHLLAKAYKINFQINFSPCNVVSIHFNQFHAFIVNKSNNTVEFLKAELYTPSCVTKYNKIFYIMSSYCRH